MHTIVDHIITEQTEISIKVHQAIHLELAISTHICQAQQRPSRPHVPIVLSTWEVQIQVERLLEVALTLTTPSSTLSPIIWTNLSDQLQQHITIIERWIAQWRCLNTVVIAPITQIKWCMSHRTIQNSHARLSHRIALQTRAMRLTIRHTKEEHHPTWASMLLREAIRHLAIWIRVCWPNRNGRIALLIIRVARRKDHPHPITTKVQRKSLHRHAIAIPDIVLQPRAKLLPIKATGHHQTATVRAVEIIKLVDHRVTLIGLIQIKDQPMCIKTIKIKTQYQPQLSCKRRIRGVSRTLQLRMDQQLNHSTRSIEHKRTNLLPQWNQSSNKYCISSQEASQKSRKKDHQLGQMPKNSRICMHHNLNSSNNNSVLWRTTLCKIHKLLRNNHNSPSCRSSRPSRSWWVNQMKSHQTWCRSIKVKIECVMASKRWPRTTTTRLTLLKWVHTNRIRLWWMASLVSRWSTKSQKVKVSRMH